MEAVSPVNAEDISRTPPKNNQPEQIYDNEIVREITKAREQEQKAKEASRKNETENRPPSKKARRPDRLNLKNVVHLPVSVKASEPGYLKPEHGPYRNIHSPKSPSSPTSPQPSLLAAELKAELSQRESSKRHNGGRASRDNIQEGEKDNAPARPPRETSSPDYSNDDAIYSNQSATTDGRKNSSFKLNKVPDYNTEGIYNNESSISDGQNPSSNDSPVAKVSDYEKVVEDIYNKEVQNRSFSDPSVAKASDYKKIDGNIYNNDVQNPSSSDPPVAKASDYEKVDEAIYNNDPPYTGDDSKPNQCASPAASKMAHYVNANVHDKDCSSKENTPVPNGSHAHVHDKDCSSKENTPVPNGSHAPKSPDYVNLSSRDVTGVLDGSDDDRSEIYENEAVIQYIHRSHQDIVYSNV